MGIYYVSEIPYDSDYLMHYGIKGQKWGVRRFQNPDGTLTAAGMKRYNSARSIQRDLNKLDREISYNRGDAMKTARKASSLDRKMIRYDKRHPDDDKGKREKYASKMQEYTDRVKDIHAKNNEYRKMQEGLLWAALGRGMNVSTKQISRKSVRPGEHFAKQSLATIGAIGMAMVSPVGVGFYSTTPRVQGTKYKVRNNKEAQKLLNGNVVLYEGYDPKTKTQHLSLKGK